MKKEKYNKFLKPLAYTMLFFAAAHVIVATFLAITRLDLHYINIFYISGLNELIPNIDNGTVSFLISTAIILVIYAVFKAKKKQNN